MSTSELKQRARQFVADHHNTIAKQRHRISREKRTGQTIQAVDVESNQFIDIPKPKRSPNLLQVITKGGVDLAEDLSLADRLFSQIQPADSDLSVRKTAGHIIEGFIASKNNTLSQDIVDIGLGIAQNIHVAGNELADGIIEGIFAIPEAISFIGKSPQDWTAEDKEALGDAIAVALMYGSQRAARGAIGFISRSLLSKDSAVRATLPRLLAGLAPAIITWYAIKRSIDDIDERVRSVEDFERPDVTINTFDGDVQISANAEDTIVQAVREVGNAVDDNPDGVFTPFIKRDFIEPVDNRFPIEGEEGSNEFGLFRDDVADEVAKPPDSRGVLPFFPEPPKPPEFQEEEIEDFPTEIGLTLGPKIPVDDSPPPVDPGGGGGVDIGGASALAALNYPDCLFVEPENDRELRATIQCLIDWLTDRGEVNGDDIAARIAYLQGRLRENS
jgi:hypothetical protein